MIVVRTPLRVSFLGGGTDFPEHYRNHGGAVISTAIDKYIYVIVKQRFDDMVYVNYSKKEPSTCAVCGSRRPLPYGFGSGQKRGRT